MARDSCAFKVHFDSYHPCKQVWHVPLARAHKCDKMKVCTRAFKLLQYIRFTSNSHARHAFVSCLAFSLLLSVLLLL